MRRGSTRTRAWCLAMNFSKRLHWCVFVLLASSCEASSQGAIPTFPDGGLLRTGTPLNREDLYVFEGMYRVSAGGELFGDQVAVRTSKGTVSLMTDEHGF